MSSPAAIVARLRAAGCVFAEEEAAILVAQAPDGALEEMLLARTGGLPLEQVLGWAEFAGLRLRVAPGVFVPRRRSTWLVELAGGHVRPGSVVVDLCCGTGALAAAVLDRHPDADVHAADLDPAAVAVARSNLDPTRVFAGDLYDALPARLRGRLDVVLVNAPYVPTDAIAQMPPEARDHEHRLALDGGADGLDVQRRIAGATPGWLSDGGVLVIETSAAQAPVTESLFEAVGLRAEVLSSEEREATAVRAWRDCWVHRTGPSDPG